MANVFTDGVREYENVERLIMENHGRPGNWVMVYDGNKAGDVGSVDGMKERKIAIVAILDKNYADIENEGRINVRGYTNVFLLDDSKGKRIVLTAGTSWGNPGFLDVPSSQRLVIGKDNILGTIMKDQRIVHYLELIERELMSICHSDCIFYNNGKMCTFKRFTSKGLSSLFMRDERAKYAGVCPYKERLYGVNGS